MAGCLPHPLSPPRPHENSKETQKNNHRSRVGRILGPVVTPTPAAQHLADGLLSDEVQPVEGKEGSAAGRNFTVEGCLVCCGFLICRFVCTRAMGGMKKRCMLVAFHGYAAWFL